MLLGSPEVQGAVPQGAGRVEGLLQRLFFAVLYFFFFFFLFFSIFFSDAYVKSEGFVIERDKGALIKGSSAHRAGVNEL